MLHAPLWHVGPVLSQRAFTGATVLGEGKGICIRVISTEPALRRAGQWYGVAGRMSTGARGVVVSHPLSMREALGSIPSVSICVRAAWEKNP